MTARLHFADDASLLVLWYDVVTQPFLPDGSDPHLKHREDATFGHGSIHLLVIDDGEGEAAAVLFTRSDDDGEEQVWGRWVDSVDEGRAQFLEAETLLREVDPS